MSQFVHLRTHSEYSITRGIIKIDEAVKKCVSDNIPAIAITDNHNLFGAIKFYEQSRGKGVKPIIGSDLWVENPDDPKSPYKVLMLCKNFNGYQNLMKLISRSYLENQNGKGEPMIKKFKGLDMTMKQK